MMPRLHLTILFLLAFALASVSVVAGTQHCGSGLCLNVIASAAQQNVGRGSIVTPRDPELEKQAMHNLEVARYYFKRKPDKADYKNSLERLNKAIESRLVEIVDLHPNFSKIDEVYFLFGEIHRRSGETEKAVEAYTKVVKEYPDSQFVQEAKKRLEELKAQDKEKKGH
jgi:outer membrane protein assembly factor BamD (BamD/ComL family)